MPTLHSRRVAIAGLGPKGLFALRAPDRPRLRDSQRRARIEIDLYEPHPAPGAGPVYDPAQPRYLRMNFAADQLDMWWPAEPGRAAPRPPVVRRLARRAGGGDEAYPPRAEAGRYLCDGLEHAAALRAAERRGAAAPHAPSGRCARARAAGRSRRAARRRPMTRCWSRSGTRTPPAAGLANGWAHAAPLVPAVFPVERMLARDAVAPGATVAIRGFALTFIDAALALTEGRGGSFEPLGDPAPPALRARRGRCRRRSCRSRAAAGRCSPSPARRSPRGRRRSRPSPPRAARRIAALAAAAAICSEDVAADPGRRARTRASIAVAGDTRDDDAEPAERDRSLAAVGAGLVPPGSVLGARPCLARPLPGVVERLGGDGLRRGDWPAFLRLAGGDGARRLRPPAGQCRQAARADRRRARRPDAPPRRARSPRGRAHAAALGSAASERSTSSSTPCCPPRRRGPRRPARPICSPTATRASRPGGAGSMSPRTARAAPSTARSPAACPRIGRPTEDSVIGNDTLSRTLHPHADRWAQRVVAVAVATRRTSRARRAACRHERAARALGCEGIVPLPARLEPWQVALCEQPAAARRAARALRLAAQRHRIPRRSRATRRSCRASRTPPASTCGSSSPARRTRRSRSSTRPSATDSASTSPASASCGRCSSRGVPAGRHRRDRGGQAARAARAVRRTPARPS